MINITESLQFTTEPLYKSKIFQLAYSKSFPKSMWRSYVSINRFSFNIFTLHPSLWNATSGQRRPTPLAWAVFRSECSIAD